MKEYTTACPRNCYSTCSLKVYVDKGTIRKILPHPKNKATREGVCLKGQSYCERVYSKERILYPLKRNPKNGTFQKITWDEALTTLSTNLASYKNQFGSKSILFLAGSGAKGVLNGVSMNFWNLFGGCSTTYGDLCWQAGLEATRLCLGENKHSAPWDMSHSKLIICWGKNPAETNIHQMNFILEAKSRNATVIVIDPRRTPTADKADLLVQPRPGTDGALALGIANFLIQKEYYDVSFIQNYVQGFEPFSEMVKGYPVEKVSAITAIPTHTIIELAEMIGTIAPMTITGGFGMQRFSNGGQSVRAILALIALTGNIGKAGAGWVYANLSSHIFGTTKDPLSSFPTENEEEAVQARVSITKLGQDILAQDNPPIKMIWVERGNPVSQAPETHRVVEAFRNTEFCVVIDQFMTDTALEADMVLPAKSMFEQTDLINAYWHDYIQLQQKIINPPGEVKPEGEIYRLLAERLCFKRQDIENLLPGSDETRIRHYLENKLKPFPGLSLEKLAEGPILSPFAEPVAFTNMKFNTPSGKIELVSQEAHERWGVQVLPEYSEPKESNKREGNNSHPLCLLTPNTKNTIHSQFGNLSVMKEIQPEPEAMVNPRDAEEREIKNGDHIRIFNSRGELKLRAVFDFSIKPGCVVVYNGWWKRSGAGVNVLSRALETDMAYGAAFHDNTIQMERI